MSSPEDRPEISVYQSQHFGAQLSETATSFTAQVTDGKNVVVFTYTPPQTVAIEFIPFVAPSSAPESVTDQPSQVPIPEQQETEKTVSLYGRTGTDPFHATAPSGEPMTIVAFYEHPSWDKESFSHTTPEKIKQDSVYWQAAAFGDKAQLLDDIPKGKASILIGYPKKIKKVGQKGKEETIENGFMVMDRKPVLGTPKPH